MKKSEATLADVADYGNLLIAHAMAKRGKTHYQSIQTFEENKDEKLHELSALLMSGKYRTSPYIHKTINDSGKERYISILPYYPDRIVHWAIMLQIEEVIMRRLSADTHAAIPGRGTHSALRRVRSALIADEENTRYCLKIDVRKYFPHINHAVLKSQIERIITDPPLIDLIFEIIDSVDDSDGVPIGNYLSQYFANVYLSWFDHWVRSKFPDISYTRYMDDMVFLGRSSERLRQVFREVEWYLLKNLYLEIKPNWQIFPVNVRGIDFIGYRIRRNSVTLRKSIWLRLRRKCRQIQAADTFTDSHRSSVAAYLGWVKYCTRPTRCKIYKDVFEPIFQKFNVQPSKNIKEWYK